MASSYFTRKKVLNYLYEQLTGNFAGFVIGMAATGLVSGFFETRSIRNLWGITSKKAIVSKETFAALEWTISIVVGFVVFEIMTKVVREKLQRHLPSIKTATFRFIVRNDLKKRWRNTLGALKSKRLVFFTGFADGFRRATRNQ